MKPKADLPSVAAALAASLIGVDGRIDEREKAVANVVGGRMIPGYSPRLFENLLDGVNELPTARQLAVTVRDLVTDADKALIMEFLVTVASADDQLVEVEVQELQEVALALGTDLPDLNISSVKG